MSSHPPLLPSPSPSDWEENDEPVWKHKKTKKKRDQREGGEGEEDEDDEEGTRRTRKKRKLRGEDNVSVLSVL